MSRSAIRVARNLEKNPIDAIEKMKLKYMPELYDIFGRVTDPRDERYITYSSKIMLGRCFFKNVVGIKSMQVMTDVFNDCNSVANIYAAIYTKLATFEKF